MLLSPRWHERGANERSDLLLTCGVEEHIELTHVELTPSRTDHNGEAGIRFRGFSTDIEGLFLATSLEATNSLMLMLIGGHVAEQIQGYEPLPAGSSDDFMRIGLLIACLSGARRDEIDLVRQLYTASVPRDADLEDAGLEACMDLLNKISRLVELRCGGDLDRIYSLLIAEAKSRLSICEVVLERLSFELFERGRLEADEVKEILRRTPWCGVLGPPVITSFFTQTWPSEYVLEMLRSTDPEQA